MFDVDHRLLDLVAAHRIAVLDRAAVGFAELDASSAFWVLALVGFVGLVVSRRSWRALVAVPLAVWLAGTTASLLKQVVAQRRPFHAQAIVHSSGFAMPSDHAAYTAAMAVVLVCAVDWGSRRARRVAAFVAAGCTAVIGGLMVYAGVHWLSDVLAGWVLGIAIGLAVDRATAALWPARQAQSAPSYEAG